MPSSDVLNSKSMIMPKLEKTNSVRCCKCSFPATNKTSFVVGRRQENTFFGTYSKILRMHTLNGYTALRKWSISEKKMSKPANVSLLFKTSYKLSKESEIS